MEQTHWMIAMECKIEIVGFIDEAINVESVATDWL